MSASSGTTFFSEGPSDGTHHVTQEGEASTLQVSVISLDEYCAKNGKSPELLLIDVEGEEMSVLQGGLSVLQRMPKLIIEHHGREREGELTEWLQAHGYLVSPLGSRHIFAEAAPPNR